MFHKDLEEILKKKFETEHTELDHDALWARVHPEIKKDRKKPFWMMFLAIGLIMIGVLIGWMLNSKNTTGVVAVATDSSNSEVEQNIKNSSILLPVPTDVVSDKEEEVENSNAKKSKFSSTGRKLVRVNEQSDKQFVSKEFIKPSFSFIDDKPIKLNAHVTEKMNITTNRNLLNILKINSLKAKSLDVDRPMISVSKLSVDKKILSEASFSKVWSVESLAGYGLLSRNLSTTMLSRVDDLEWRNINEEGLDALSADLSIGYQFDNNWKVRFGFDYQMITDRTIHVSEFTEVVPAQNALGLELLETVVTDTKYNYFNSIGLPLELVYLIGNESLGIELGTGLRLSRMFKAQGMIYTESDAYALNTDLENRFGRNVTVDLLADIGMYVSVTNRINWITRIQYQYGLNGINTTTNPIDQKYNLLKIKTGLSYQF